MFTPLSSWTAMKGPGYPPERAVQALDAAAGNGETK
jgi:hypothetical protein